MYLVIMWMLVVLLYGGGCNNQKFSNTLDSQLWLNGSTTVLKKAEDSNVHVQYNHPWDMSIPLFNYSHEFNGFQKRHPWLLEERGSAGRELNFNNNNRGTEWSSEMLTTTTEGTGVCSPKRIQECADDKVELDFLQGKKISLEIDLMKLESIYNVTQGMLQECKRDEAIFKSIFKNHKPRGSSIDK